MGARSRAGGQVEREFRGWSRRSPLTQAGLATALALALASPAYADSGGASGFNGGVPSPGGAGNPTGAGNPGTSSTVATLGGGGGGAGVTGGGGGSGDGFGAGGTGGAAAVGGIGGNGGMGGLNAVGGGGGGGAHGGVLTTSTTGGTFQGGFGGGGGGGAVAGGGGEGGYGVVVNGTGLIFTNTATSTGGAGGAGGIGAFAGSGGDGGFGVYLTGGNTLDNTGTVTGGQGGAGGTGASPGAVGNGGAGVTGSNLTILNAGAISGGFAGDGVTQADAIIFTGGANTLTLQPGWSLTGNISVSGSVTFNQSSAVILPNIIIGTGGVIENATATLTLTGANTYTGGTTVSAGTLQMSGSGTLGAASGHLTVSGGTLDLGGTTQTQNGGLTLTGGTVQNGTLSSAGSFAVQSGTVSANLSGAGSLQKSTSGTVTLSGANNYSGNTQISGGTILVGSNSAFGTSPIVMSGATTLGFVSGGNFTVGNNISFGSMSLALDPNFTPPAGTTQTLSGIISGNGSLTMNGAGTLVLTGANSYTAGTTITAGLINFSNGGNFGTANITLNGGGLQWATGNTLDISSSLNPIGSGGGTFDTNGNNVTLASALSGVGGITKQGAGTLILDGVNTYTGGTAVSGGTLEIGDINNPGASVAGDVAVGAGATLAGHGTIGGNVANLTGNVAPGGTIGTLVVAGNYTQGSSGTLTIEVSPSAASQLKVGGAANLAGTLALLYDPGVYTAKTYTLLTATSVGGTFSQATGTVPTAGLSQTVLINPANVQLALTAAATPTPTPTPTAPVIVIVPTNDTIYSAATSIAVMNAQEVNGIILDRIGARQAGVADGQVAAGLAPGGVGSGVAGAQLAQAGGNGAALGEVAAALPDALSSQGAWFRGLGGFASVNGNASAPGFTGSTGGFLAGYDRPISQNIYLGVAGGYLHSNIDEHSTSSGTEGSARFNVYGGALVGSSLLSATAGYANDRFTTNRGIAGIGTASENHAGNEATAAGQWSLPLTIPGYGGGVATLTPKAGLEYLYLSEGAFSETGASGFDLSNAGRGTDSLQPYVGAALAQKFVTAGGTEITPELRLGYAHELFDSRLLTVTTVNGAAFSVEGVRPSRDQLTAGLGIVMQAAPNLSAYADYDTIVHTGNTTEQTVQAGLRFKF